MKFVLTIAIALLLSPSVFGAEPNKSEVNMKRAELLRADIKAFQLSLSYVGQADKPYYHVLFSVPLVAVKHASPFRPISQISEDQARKIIAHLAETGILGQSSEMEETIKLPQPYYRLTVKADELHFSLSLGWGKQMLNSLDHLRKVMDGDAAKDMDMLLGRLSGHRKEWVNAVK